MKTTLTLAVLTLFTAVAAHAEVISKGGATKLLPATSARSETPVARPMTCPRCKSEFLTVTAPNFKGTERSVVTIERHACPDCRTKWITTGHGKAKIESAVHACLGCKS